LIHFKDIPLGQASAELEGSYYPDLMLNGFLDPWDIIDKAIYSPKFLFLGYKGSGKSAIGEHLRLKAASDPNLFVKSTFLSDFPYGNFSSIVTGDAEPESRFPSAWSWLLILNLLTSFAKDEGAYFEEKRSFHSTIDALKKVGLLPTDNIKETVIASSKPKFKAKLPSILEMEIDGNPKKLSDLDFLHIIENLKSVMLKFRSDNKHIFIIDGLDDILLQKEVQYQSIAALILEVTRLNSLLFENNVPGKILVLCRTELYEKLPGPNKNKVRQDLSIELDWYHNPHKPSSSKLVYLLNKRAQLSDKSIQDVFLKFLPRTISGKSLLFFCLQLTRHTPRDFIQLFVNIQECSSRRIVDMGQVWAGLSRYSSRYFLPEIQDELVGYTSLQESEAILKAISKMKKREFTVNEISKSLQNSSMLEKRDLFSILDILYQCSAIGNVKERNGKCFFSFKYRNRHSQFQPDEGIILHKGLWKGMNVV
jgi:hypothetical protein